jgi:hypothetical protein
LEKSFSETASAVKVVWKEVYDRQNSVLIWPKIERDDKGVVIKPGLSDDFVRGALKLPPPERLGGNGMDPAQTADTQFWITNSQRFKQEYRAFGKTQIEALCKTLKTNYRIGVKEETSKAETATEAGAEEAAATGEWVIWSQKSQQGALEHLLFQEGRDPPTQAILYAQEDLWVYQALANAITKTNVAANTLGNYNAAIKRIQDIQIGEKREAKVGKDIFRVGGSKSTEKAGAAADAEDEAEEKVVEIPAYLTKAGKRYVDAAGNPLKGESLLALGTTAEFKRMPIYLKIDMDQRYLGRFLTECANSQLTIETKQITGTVEPPAESATGETEDKTASGSTGGSKKDTKNAYDLTLEMAAIVYIYYPPPAETTPPAEGEEPKEDLASTGQ